MLGYYLHQLRLRRVNYEVDSLLVYRAAYYQVVRRFRGAYSIMKAMSENNGSSKHL
jgi:hypothetical protein